MDRLGRTGRIKHTTRCISNVTGGFMAPENSLPWDALFGWILCQLSCWEIACNWILVKFKLLLEYSL